MGCKTCKNKKKYTKGEARLNSAIDKIPNSDTIDLIPEGIADGPIFENFWFKVVAFIAMTVAIPLIILVLMGKMFLTFFMPKSLPKVSKRLSKASLELIKKYTKFIHDKEVRKRKRQFEKTVEYHENNVFEDDDTMYDDTMYDDTMDDDTMDDETMDDETFADEVNGLIWRNVEDDEDDEDDEYGDIDIHEDNNEKE